VQPAQNPLQTLLQWNDIEQRAIIAQVGAAQADLDPIGMTVGAGRRPEVADQMMRCLELSRHPNFIHR
jgi:hypothetical protein